MTCVGFLRFTPLMFKQKCEVFCRAYYCSLWLHTVAAQIVDTTLASCLWTVGWSESVEKSWDQEDRSHSSWKSREHYNQSVCMVGTILVLKSIFSTGAFQRRRFCIFSWEALQVKLEGIDNIDSITLADWQSHDQPGCAHALGWHDTAHWRLACRDGNWCYACARSGELTPCNTIAVVMISKMAA